MAGLLCFGLGYSARALARHLPSDRWTVIGTAREVDTQGCLRFDRDHPLPTAAFEGITHILVSIPPDEDGDPVHDCHAEDIAALSGLDWLGYLSTTGVYGNRDGGWVEEGSELRPTSARGERRVAAEVAWRELWRTHGVPVHIFRLAGIYGPGRSAFDAIRAGTARRFERPGQVFSRIHVDDLAAVLAASIARPRPGAVYNVCDDAPAAPEAVIAHAATMLGVAAPPLEPFDAAALSPMARSFWADNKRVSNALVKKELGIELRYPDFRAGLAAILAGGG
jgi:nucleoside-diphosphate-sugar epimerase